MNTTKTELPPQSVDGVYAAGQRLRLTKDVERFPEGIYPKGTTGTFVGQRMGVSAMRLDEFHDELKEWDNCLLWNEDSDYSRFIEDETEPLVEIDVRNVPVEFDTLESRLASEFSRVLRSWLTVGEMEQVISRNKRETDPRICHSHDFCDANMAMDEAFTTITGRELDADDGSDVALWGKAWDIALKSEFAV
jgi:hypothetical protein